MYAWIDAILGPLSRAPSEGGIGTPSRPAANQPTLQKTNHKVIHLGSRKP